ncbi:SDR family NAD(P)-dependent oxidoreductase [Aureicoccus marinus]|jgi:NAD(P)-dependent dehydrogenase (short-subunit alcohol dehydrogenase family)|uniref:Oxidoreductase n=1 Tax=Aureicoccus marinus TaxID=754435 RepID=A0A2S7T5E8_9FLAO|nr:SDR family oxidoreductase [Aureicoccus marinus]PQJ15143.1 oxidoreductase [Aureicoccus marinus]
MAKKHLIIGGSYGIGAALVELLPKEDDIFIASRTNESHTADNITHLPFDVLTDDVAFLALPAEMDSLVYCPGSINLKPFKMLSVDQFKEEMELNFFGLVRTVKGVIDRMKQGSSMVFYSTVAVQTGMPFHSSIASSKGAIEGFVRSMAAEYAPKIRVNAIAPSLVDTPLAARLLNNDKKREMMAERHPLKRVGEANDIAQMTAFLLNDNSSWITGQVFGVDGGKSSLSV